MGEIEPSYEVEQTIVSPDGKRVAWLAKRKGKRVVFLNGQAGFEAGAILTPIFSPDGQRLAYAAKRSKKWQIVVDGQAGPEFESVSRLPVFSPDSQTVVYVASRRKKLFLVVDGREEGTKFDRSVFPVFNLDGKRFAHAAMRGKKAMMVLDGQPGPEFDDLGVPIFSPDGRRFAYRAMREKKWVMMVDGQQLGSEFDGLTQPVFSPDSQHIAYASKTGKRWRMFIDAQQQGPEFDFILTGPAFAPDNERIAYLYWLKEKHEGREMREVFGEQTRAFDASRGDPLYVPPKEQAYVAPTRPYLYRPYLPPAYGFGHAIAVGIMTALKAANFVEELTISPNGRRLAHVLGHGGPGFSVGDTTRGKRRVIVDGQAGKEYNPLAVTDLTFSPDSEHLVYAVQDFEKGKSLVVIDDQEGKIYEVVVPGSLQFLANNTFSYFARSQRKVYRVTQTMVCQDLPSPPVSEAPPVLAFSQVR